MPCLRWQAARAGVVAAVAAGAAGAAASEKAWLSSPLLAPLADAAGGDCHPRQRRCRCCLRGMCVSCVHACEAWKPAPQPARSCRGIRAGVRRWIACAGAPRPCSQPAAPATALQVCLFREGMVLSERETKREREMRERGR